MPELPEVETVRGTLEGQIIGKTITNIEVYYAAMLENTTKEKFIHSLIGQTFQKIERYGKYLIFILDDYTILSHLRMEGKYFLKDIHAPLEKHEHIVFILNQTISFRYHDTRKFGKMALLKTTKMQEIMKYSSLSHLGKEANDTQFTKEELYDRLKHKHVPIKTALLNQEIICGLGNIYVDEVCFMSKLNPKMSSCHITMEDASNILKSSRSILAKAIQAGGTTIRSYTSSLGVTGRFQLELLVHSKENEPCPICNTKIVKIKVGGRGTYVCPNCQAPREKKVIGITGSIATGKSEVTKYLKEKGYAVVDADEIVKEEKNKNKSIYHALLEKIGRKILSDNGEIDNQKLARFIYESDENRLLVNAIVHPIVKEKIQENIKNIVDELIFISVPLLFEAHFETLCSKIICVYASPEVEIQRLMMRNHCSYDEAVLRISKQISQEEKCKKADYIIDNSYELCYTLEQVDKILKEVKKTYGNH